MSSSTILQTNQRGEARLPGLVPWLILTFICVAFLTVRVPIVYLQPGGQDEACYAVPGLMVLRSGVPSLPHVPANNTDSVYYRADEALFSEPPLTFYLQAVLYSVLPDQYGTARLVSVFAGIGILLVLFLWAGKMGISRVAALWGIGLLSASRWFYFAALAARPDLLCTFFGIVAIFCMAKWLQGSRNIWFLSCGICIGLGGLTHPFAAIYALQLAGWIAISKRGWSRLTRPVLLAGIAIVVFSVWLPLILKFPETSRIQFENQFKNDAGGSLLQRAIMPWNSVSYHAEVMWNHAGVWQFCLALSSLVICTVLSFRRADVPLRTLCALAWSAIYLLAVSVGQHHQVIGYWSYPAALIFLCVGVVVERIAKWIAKLPFPRFAQITFSVLLAGSLLSGMGLRTLLVHLQHRGEVNYNAPAFARELMDSLPADKTYVVDTQFALDFFAAGRTTLWAQVIPKYFRADQFEYDYVIISREGLDSGISEQLGGELIKTVGDRDDPFACFAEIYRVSKSPNPKVE